MLVNEKISHFYFVLSVLGTVRGFIELFNKESVKCDQFVFLYNKITNLPVNTSQRIHLLIYVHDQISIILSKGSYLYINLITLKSRKNDI